MIMLPLDKNFICDCLREDCPYCGQMINLNIVTEPKKNEKNMNEKKKIRRTPIVLSKNTIAMIHIFEKYDDMDDLWMYDLSKYAEENYEQYEKAAKQFISQLKEHWCVLFMEHLIKESFKQMVEEDRSAFTEENAKKLLNELKEINDKR